MRILRRITAGLDSLRALAAGFDRRGGKWVVAALLGAAGGLLAVALAGSTEQRIGPLDTTFSARPTLNGGTTVELAPLGSLQLDTHAGIVHLQVDVDRLRLLQAQELLEDEAAVERLPADIEREARSALRDLVQRCLFVALIGGALTGFLHRPHWLSGLVGALAGVVVVAASLGQTALTWRPDALDEPRYTGLLTLAPQAIGDVRDATEKFSVYRTQLNALVDNVSRLYETTEAVSDFPAESNTVRVLHVSDLHLNPAGFDLTQQMVRQFKPSFVIDSGDINDWGTTFEAGSVARIGSVGVPYVFVRGNHDSAETQAAVAAQPNAVVLDGNAVDVAGLRVWGIGDPRFTADKELYGDKEVERETAAAFSPVALQRYTAANTPPIDIAVVHDRTSATGLDGVASLVLSGHAHRSELRRAGSTTHLVQGSTGGAGLRGVNESGDVQPLECAVLYFDKTTRRLIAYDQVTVAGLGGSGAQIQRHYVTGSGDASTPTTTSTITAR